VVCIAYFIGHTIHKKQQTHAPATAQPAAAAPLEPQKTSGDAKTSGSDSPAVTGNGNDTNYNKSAPPQKQKPNRRNEGVKP